MKSLVKQLLARTGYRVLNGRRRWGVEMLDDATRVLGDANGFKTVFDVGANFGQSAIAYAKAFPEAAIHAFEPVGETFSRMEANVASERRVHPWRLALGDRQSEQTITLYGDAGKSSLHEDLKDQSRGATSRQETVQVETLDGFAERESIEQIDLLKIDTEGFDLRVMHGAEKTLRDQRIALVYCEFHHYFAAEGGHPDGLGSLSDLHDFLAECGYRLLTTYTDAVSPSEDLGTHNALFIAESIEPRWVG